MLYALRESVGDFDAPGYLRWSAQLQDHYYAATFMICMQWVVFFFNLVIMMIVMSNFVIAVVSQSYDASMAEEEVAKYQMRSEMNFEMMAHNEMK